MSLWPLRLLVGAPSTILTYLVFSSNSTALKTCLILVFGFSSFFFGPIITGMINVDLQRGKVSSMLIIRWLCVSLAVGMFFGFFFPAKALFL
jgi:hypothetical protein